MSGVSQLASGVARGDPSAQAAVRSALYVVPPKGHSPLRVALVVPGEVPAWMLRFFELARSSAWVEMVILPVTGASTPRVSGVAADVRGYLAFERFRHRNRSAGRLLTPVDVVADDASRCVAGLRADMPVAEVRQVIRQVSPDLVMLVGTQAWADALAECAVHGCWWLDAGLLDPGYGGLTLLAPIVDGKDATELGLELAYPDGQVDRMDSSWGSTLADSFELQRDEAFRKLPALLMRALRKMAAAGPRTGGVRQCARLRFAAHAPGVGAGLRAFAIALWRHAGRRMHRGRAPDPWKLALRRAETPIDPARPVVDRTLVVAAQPGYFWADPCVVVDGAARLLFVEEFAAPAGKGSIVCLETGEGGSVERLGTALEEAWHLSYPQVFQWQGHWHMTVESGAARCVSLYRANGFPLRWTRIGDLLVDRVCVDPTLHEHEGHWYLFANVSESEGSTCDELFLFVADSPLGPFRPHPGNPIVSDVRRARPAGKLFHRNGRLIRPAQDCGPSYGAGIVFNEILALSPTRYSERPLGRLGPWRRQDDGCHTYCAVEELEVFDVRDRSVAAP